MILSDREGADPARPAMKWGGFDRRARRAESGSALLIVLAFILIIAVVLTAFLSSSQRALKQSESSSTILKTQMLGEVATNAVIDDLREEMRAGADGDPADGDIMEVSEPWAMVPWRVLKEPGMLTNPDFLNLVKQSAGGQAFYPDDNPVYTGTATSPTSRASAASTTIASRNQRVISPKRWDKPRLLGSGTGFSPAEVPDWIYITRAGVVESGTSVGNLAVADKSPLNTEYVLGRFAYNIYRIDGLLDINVAGFDPSDLKAVTAAASKGSSALADLRALPGLSSDASVKAIVEWRNKESRSNYPAMIAGLTGTSAANANPENWGEPGGFQMSYTDGAKTDNRFFSRQDLINFFDHQFGETGDQLEALPFLTTFSADLNQPSFRPDPNRPKVVRSASTGGNDAFGDEGQPESSQINPPMLSVLDADQNPLVKRRFPLDRLKYVVPSPPEANKSLIEKYFGLIWNESNKEWRYVDIGSIKRLHEIQGREPNMIELLRAAIATGSLGGQFDSDEKAGSPRKMGNRDASISFQVMRIAACLIDQYDGDSHPTRIRFGDPAGINYMAYGVENLPYLYGMRIVPYRQDVVQPAAMSVQPPIPGTVHRSVIMIQPILWNPHAPPATPREGPTLFRVTADSGSLADITPTAKKSWSPNTGAYVSDWPDTGSDARDLNTPIAFNRSGDFISFSVMPDDSQSASPMAAFREPYALKSPGYPAGSNSKAHRSGVEFSELTLGADEQNDTAAGENSDRAIGFRAGWSWGGPRESNTSFYFQEGELTNNGIDIELQYQSPSGDWITIDSLEKFGADLAYRLGRLNSGGENPRAARFYLRADPRVDRYGTRSSLFLPAPASPGGTGTPLLQGQSIRPGADQGLSTNTNWPNPPDVGESSFMFYYPITSSARFLGLLSENKPGSEVRYKDPDGVNRVAMGGYSAGLDGLPMAIGNFSSRPVVLNRPFRSVAELGHVLRDQPWKQLDFFSPESGDAALLDIFCLYESENPEAEPVVAGRVNLNTPRQEVIEALLKGVELRAGSVLSDTADPARALVEWTASSDAAKGPLRNRSELVGKFISGTSYSGFSTEFAGELSDGADRAIPIRRQNALRGLVDMGTTRSWTFLIDLIVQDGQFSRQGGASGDFTVRGEKRLWVHVAIDRFTGKVISQRVEEVYE